MYCGDYQKDKRCLRNWIVMEMTAMEMTEGDVIQGCDGDDGRSYNSRMYYGDYQKDNRWLIDVLW